jgi:hypothetical protein
MVRNPRARRYVLRLRPDGSARVTIPRGGSAAEARRFVDRNKEWLERQSQRVSATPRTPIEWRVGMQVYFRGELLTIEAAVGAETPAIRLGSEVVRVPNPAADVRAAIESHLWNSARRELPQKVHNHAALHQVDVGRVMVRNQRSRWGSCSRHGTISLNWRLIQTPKFVQDYVVIHEIMHLREMNHSPRFWRHVERACPDCATAERWLKQHAILLR